MNRRWPPALLVLIFAVGLALRCHHLSTVPKQNETIDEFAWTWSGISLVTEGTPTAWSLLPAYTKSTDITFRDWGYRVVRPFLDHPPLFSLLMGTWMVIGGYRELYGVDLTYMRSMSVLLFIAAFWLLWQLLSRFFDERDVLFGLLFFAISPLVVIDQKLVISENLIVVSWVATYLAMLHYLDTGERTRLVWVVLGAATLPFTKVAALGLSLHLWLVGWLRRDRRLLAAVVGGTVLGFVAFLLYGTHYDSALFWAVMHAHSNRFSGFGGFFELVFHLKAVNTYFIYLPFVLGVVAIFSNLSDPRTRELYLVFPIYAGCMTFFVDMYNTYGWYLIPMYPVLCMGIGQLTRRMLRDADPTQILVWSVFSLPYIHMLLLDHFPGSIGPLRYFYLASFAAVVALLALGKRGHIVSRWVGGALVASLVLVDLQYLIDR